MKKNREKKFNKKNLRNGIRNEKEKIEKNFLGLF